MCNKGPWDQSSGAMNDWAFHLSWIVACRRVMRPSGTLWVFGTCHSIYLCGLTLQQLGFRILNEVIWYKPNAVPNLSCRVLTASHETLIWARRDPKARHTFNYQELKHGSWPKDFLKRPERQMRSVWAVSPSGSKEKTHGRHPTQKPLELLDRMILASAKPGDLVLDPFVGSGTTALAALRARCQFIGVDQNRDYLRLCRRRVESLSDET